MRVISAISACNRLSISAAIDCVIALPVSDEANQVGGQTIGAIREMV
ncbi:hypothetical protein [Xanthocytophaga flava]|nr:hypothetical protein [Xanthocytophaga flavus]MDJ1472572.1 hypothetical protein [Xanthocytophaga flavus]